MSPILDIDAGEERLDVVLSAARNPWTIGVGYGFGILWLVLVFAFIVVAIASAPPGQRMETILGVFIAFMVTILIHVLAVAGIWAATYALSGSETLRMNVERVQLERRALGITIPFKHRRGYSDRVVLIDDEVAVGRVPHPKLELHAGRSMLRFGAGLSRVDAEELAKMAQDFLDSTRDEALHSR